MYCVPKKLNNLLFFQDVDVDPAPDEKSVMTYVAQFLHRYPEGAEGKVGRKEVETVLPAQ